MERIARWESKSRKHWVDLYRDENEHGVFYSYRADGAGGTNVFPSDEDAIAYTERWAQNMQPDANRTPMRQVAAS